MIQTMKQVKRICTICARGGSKGIPNKNLRNLLGKPLIAYSIEQAKLSEQFDVIAVSSDSQQILDVAETLGADVTIIRPEEMATDFAPKLPSIQHLITEVETTLNDHFDTIVDLDVTSPLRAIDDIYGALRLMETNSASNVITGSIARKNPYFNLVEQAPDGSISLSKPPKVNIIRRQDCPKCFDMNAAVYVWNRDIFMSNPNVFYPDTLLYQMPEERSYDIDLMIDFELVEFLMTRV